MLKNIEKFNISEQIFDFFANFNPFNTQNKDKNKKVHKF